MLALWWDVDPVWAAGKVVASWNLQLTSGHVALSLRRG